MYFSAKINLLNNILTKYIEKLSLEFQDSLANHVEHMIFLGFYNVKSKILQI